MKKILTILLFASFTMINAQDRVPIFSKVTATWCVNCGTWGWDFMEEMKGKYNNSQDALILGVHYSGNLQNETARWFTDNLDPLGQPVFYFNNEDLNASRNNWSDRIANFETNLEEFKTEVPPVSFSFENAYINEADEIVAIVNMDTPQVNSGEFYFGVYIFENNVEDVQTPLGSAFHPNVLRGVMANDPYGNFLFDSNSIPSGALTMELTSTKENAWSNNSLGLVGILWEKVNDTYLMKNSSVIYNIGLLSSTSSLIDANIVDIQNNNFEINITVDDTEKYNVQLVNNLGQVIANNNFTNKTSIDLQSIETGLYTVHLSQGKNFLSKQIFVGK